MQFSAFAPRLGIAYRLHTQPGSETVVRAGAGMFYDTGTSGGAASDIFSGPAFSKSVSYTNLNIPVPASQLNFSPSANPPFAGTVYGIAPNFHLPYSIQWNVAIEQSLGNKQSVVISYVGSNGRELVRQNGLSLGGHNSVLTGTLYYASNSFTSNLPIATDSIQASAFSRLQALVSYTWSHTIDFGSTDSAYAYMRGDADFDVRNNASGAVSWAIPSVSTQRS